MNKKSPLLQIESYHLRLASLNTKTSKFGMILRWCMLPWIFELMLMFEICIWWSSFYRRFFNAVISVTRFNLLFASLFITFRIFLLGTSLPYCNFCGSSSASIFLWSADGVKFFILFAISFLLNPLTWIPFDLPLRCTSFPHHSTVKLLVSDLFVE